METDTELFERHTRVNQLGCFLGMKTVVPLMEQSGGGSIVNISSVAGLRGSPGAIAYSATKWALRGMTKAAAIDLAPRKIRVNSVHPGPIDTEMLSVRTPEQNRQRLQLVQMKRMGTAEEGRLREKRVRGGPARALAICVVRRRRVSRAWRTTLPTVLSSRKRSRLGRAVCNSSGKPTRLYADSRL